MGLKKTRTRLLVAGAAAAASALAFYFAWKAFRAYDDLHSDDEDPETEGEDLRLPCAIESEIQDLENLMKTTEEKRDSKITEEEEEVSGFRLEEFDQFIAEKYGEVLADFEARDVLSCGNGQGKLESSFKVSEIPVEGDLDGFGGYGIASRREGGTQKNILFCGRSDEGGGGSEGFVGEFSSIVRDVGFDEMSLQDMSEEDGKILGNAHQASESRRELSVQSDTDFEFDGGDSSCTDMAVGFDSCGMDGISWKTSEEHRYHEVLDLEKSSDVQISLEEKADDSINNSVEGLRYETSKPSDGILESSSAKRNKYFDCGMSADSVQSLKEHNFEKLESTEFLNSADMDCNGSVGILSSNGIVNKQSNCQREANGQSSNGLVSKEHVSLTRVENSKDGSLPHPFIGNSNGVNKGSDKLLSDLSEDSKTADVEVSQLPKFDNMDNNHNWLEDLGPDSDATKPKSYSGMDCDTLSSQAYEELLNTSDIATNKHSALQTGEDLGKQFSGKLLETIEETNKSKRAGNVKFEDHGSHLLNLPRMGGHDKSSQQLLEGSRASKLVSTMNGGSNKHSEGLDAYDSYLADPSLSPSMRSQVARAKAIAQKLYAAKEAN